MRCMAASVTLATPSEKEKRSSSSGTCAVVGQEFWTEVTMQNGEVRRWSSYHSVEFCRPVLLHTCHTINIYSVNCKACKGEKDTPA